MATQVSLLAFATAATAGDKAAVNVGMITPFIAGRTVRAIFDARGQTGTAPAYVIDGSDDNSTWVADIASTAVAEGIAAVDVKCYQWMRVSVTTAAGTLAGTLSCHLESDG